MTALLATLLLTAASAEGQAPLTGAADTHVHLAMSQGARPVVHGEPGSGELSQSPGTRLLNQVESKHLEQAGTRLLIASVWAPPPMRPTRTALTEALHQLDALQAFGRRRPEFAMVRSVAEARQALAGGRLATIPALEGGEGITRVADVDALFAAGVRSLTVVHFVDNDLAGAAQAQFKANLLGRTGTELSNRGLSALGREAVQRMLELGMLVDLAHASDAAAIEVLELAEARGVPVIDSHGGARALHPMERNISDGLAARIARTGGTVGVSLFSAQTRTVPQAERWPGFVEGTCDQVIAHWLHLAKVAGPEAITLGSDFNGFIVRPRAGGSCPQGLRNTSDLPALYAGLEAHGVPRAALDGMSARLLSAWQALEARADRAARARATLAPHAAPGLFDVAL